MSNDRAIEVTLDEQIKASEETCAYANERGSHMQPMHDAILASLRTLKRIQDVGDTVPGLYVFTGTCSDGTLSVSGEFVTKTAAETIRDYVLEMLARERERADRHEGAVRAYIEDADAMRMQRDDALIKLAKVMEGLRETYEIYAGMETTPLPILASEAYLLRIIDQMQKSVTALLRGEGSFDDLVDKELSK